MYALYCTDIPRPTQQMPELRNLTTENFPTKEAALGAACELIESGATVWRIKGPADEVMERDEIELVCIQRSLR